VVEKFRKKGYEPEAYTLYSYAAVQILAQAAEAVKSPDGKKIAEYMRSGKTFKTVIGDISYDKKGDITRPTTSCTSGRRAADGKIDYTGNEVGM
jgi:branched-chain amino acid transport system substrate-binding protein